MKLIEILGMMWVVAMITLAVSCGPSQADPTPDDVFSVNENGQTVFYSSSDKAFGDVYLGMPRYMVDSIIQNSPPVTISGRKYQSIMDYSNSGMLSSFYLMSDTLAAGKEIMNVVNEVEDVIGVKYGELDMTYVSELPELGISDFTLVNDKEVHWGAHWNEGYKYITLGVSREDSTNQRLWVWIFNTNLWEQLGENQAIKEADNF